MIQSKGSHFDGPQYCNNNVVTPKGLSFKYIPKVCINLRVVKIVFVVGINFLSCWSLCRWECWNEG